jgi:hypothetical protein
MKKIFLLFAIATIAISCKDEAKNTDGKDDAEKYGPAKLTNPNWKDPEADLPIYRGEFVHVADGAVLKGTTYIYGVVLDEVALELSERVKPIKVNDFDMVPVVVKGVISQRPEGEEGWEEILKITEILNVSSQPAKADIKIQDNNN